MKLETSNLAQRWTAVSTDKKTKLDQTQRWVAVSTNEQNAKKIDQKGSP